MLIDGDSPWYTLARAITLAIADLLLRDPAAFIESVGKVYGVVVDNVARASVRLICIGLGT